MVELLGILSHERSLSLEDPIGYDRAIKGLARSYSDFSFKSVIEGYKCDRITVARRVGLLNEHGIQNNAYGIFCSIVGA